MADDASAPSEGHQDDITNPTTTDGGYEYTVVDDEDGGGTGGGRSIKPIWLAVAAIVPAVIVGVVIWFVASGGGGGSARAERDVSNVVSAFSSGQAGTTTTRYEGTLPPGMPSVPQYPGAKVVSSLLQIRGSDAGYIVVLDSSDARDKVASYYNDQFKADPWQIVGGQDNRDSTVHQFSRIDDPNTTGLVLVQASDDASLTTIVESVQVASGAPTSKTPYVPPAARTLPDGYPDTLPAYTDALLIQAAFQKAAAGNQYAVSYITKDPAATIVGFYKDKLGAAGLTVADGDATTSSLQNAKVVTFTTADKKLSGTVAVGTFGDDITYSQIDVQATVAP